jgi:prepilin-type N-terminal cleavage/methylation domain-containing protein
MAAIFTPKASRNPATRPSRSEGFSLLEVLVATTIMGLVLVVLLQVLTAAIRAQESSWGHTQALLVAEKILQENCQVNTLKEGIYQGQDGRFDYQVKITPQYVLSTAIAEKRILCSLIQVTVTWQERGRNKTLGLETLRTEAQKAL